MSDFSIRRGISADSHALSGLMAALGYPTTEAAMSGRMERILAEADCGTFVAERDGEIRGVIGLRVRREAAWHKDDPVGGEVVVLIVLGEASRQGIGTALLAVAEEYFRGRGVAEISISCGSQRHDSHRFCRNRGYSESVWITMPGNDEDHAGKRLAAIFKKRL